MGLGAENGKVKVESWDISKSKVRRKKKKKDDDDGVEEEETGCWLRLRFFGSCISSRSKVDTSISGTSTHCGNFLYFLESIFTSCFAAKFSSRDISLGLFCCFSFSLCTAESSSFVSNSMFAMVITLQS